MTSRTVVLAGTPHVPAVPVCTILRAPGGGWAAVLHPSDCTPPTPSAHAVTFPDVASATRYARNQYGTLYVEVVEVPSPDRLPA